MKKLVLLTLFLIQGFGFAQVRWMTMTQALAAQKKEPKKIIIDFYADWCGPCKKVAPILHDLAILYKNDIVVYKINVDNEKELARTFGIQSIPTILFVPVKGKPQKAMGALPREEFVKQIDSYLLGK